MKFDLFDLFVCGFSFFSLGALVAFHLFHRIQTKSATIAYLFVAALQNGASEAELAAILK